MQINDFSTDDVQSVILQAKEENKIKRKYAQEIEGKVRKALEVVLTEDRYTVSVEIEMSFDKEKLKKHELKPVIIKPRTSGLAYDDSIIKDKLELSVQTEDEEYKGQGFIPEGPPGVEPNIPPGYKESLEEKGLYTRNKKTVNYEIGKEM